MPHFGEVTSRGRWLHIIFTRPSRFPYHEGRWPDFSFAWPVTPLEVRIACVTTAGIIRFLSVWMTVWRFYNCKVVKYDYHMVDQQCIFLSIPFGCHLELCLCDVQGFLSGLRASPAVLSMWACKNISHIQVLVTFFSNPTHKTEIGTANRWETTNSNPSGPIKPSCWSEADTQ
jgi:hypothetical protein